MLGAMGADTLTGGAGDDRLFGSRGVDEAIHVAAKIRGTGTITTAARAMAP